MKLKPEIVEAYAAVGITEAEATCMMVNLSAEAASLHSTILALDSQMSVIVAQREATQLEYDELASALVKMVEPDAAPEVDPHPVEGAPV